MMVRTSVRELGAVVVGMKMKRAWAEEGEEEEEEENRKLSEYDVLESSLLLSLFLEGFFSAQFAIFCSQLASVSFRRGERCQDLHFSLKVMALFYGKVQWIGF